jgi:hypothetical protein
MATYTMIKVVCPCGELLQRFVQDVDDILPTQDKLTCPKCKMRVCYKLTENYPHICYLR